MTKEQILGRLLMNRNITIEELNILTKFDNNITGVTITTNGYVDTVHNKDKKFELKLPNKNNIYTGGKEKPSYY